MDKTDALEQRVIQLENFRFGALFAIILLTIGFVFLSVVICVG